jgi:hypothetical protein
MWCSGSWFWMVAGGLALLAFWGVIIWLAFSLLNQREEPV